MYPLEMHYNGLKRDQPREIVELFADYSEDLYEKDDEIIDFEDIYKNSPVNPKEIERTMLDIEANLEAKDSRGPDELSPIVVKNCMDALVWPLWILYQKTFDRETIPSSLKTSRVVPICKKKGKRTDVKNYRIVAISSNILKIFEMAMHSKLHMILGSSFSNSQHGFRPRRSVSTNLVNLSITAHDAFTGK